MNALSGKLILIPTLLGNMDIEKALPAGNKGLVNNLSYFIVENARSARRFLRAWGYTRSFDEVEMYVLDKHLPRPDFQKFLELWQKGHSVGLLSEAGCPCIADPGSEVVAFAHLSNIVVMPLVGPSSILLALMGSGFNGQQFTFNGYLPIQKDERAKKIRLLEAMVRQSGITQIFMETPYRNNQLLMDLIAVLNPESRLCVACDLTLDSEWIKTQKIGEWKNKMPDLNKRTSIFLLG